MKKLVSLILALAVALSLTGAAFAEEPVTITYATFSASGAQEETLKKMVEVFEEKNPDIKVDVQLTGYDDYFTKLATTVGGGNAPDVFEMNMENFLAYMLRGVRGSHRPGGPRQLQRGHAVRRELGRQALCRAHELLHLRVVLQQGAVRSGGHRLSGRYLDLDRGAGGC